MAENSDWIFKIISGPHQGVEEVLPEGRIVVGAAPECDIVLHDVLIASHHFAFQLAGGVLQVEALEGRVYRQGRRVTSPTTVAPFDFVTAGTTHLVVGRAAARWPLLSAADAPELEKDAPTPEATAPVVLETKSDATAASTSLDGPTPMQRRRAWWLVGFGALMLVLWAFLWYLWQPAPPAASAPPTAKVRTEKILQSIPQADPIKVEEREGRLVVSGYLESDTAVQSLTSALQREVPEATVRVWSIPRLLETTRAFIAERRLNLTVDGGDKGQITIRGNVPSKTEWDRARQMLLAEVPGLQRIADEVGVVLKTAATGRVTRALPEPAAAAVSLAGVTVLAVQALESGQGWVRLSNGTILFYGGRWDEKTRLTGIEGNQAAFEHRGEKILVRAGDDLSVILSAQHSAVKPERLPQTGEKNAR